MRLPVRTRAEHDVLTRRNGPVAIRNHWNLNGLARLAAVKGDSRSCAFKRDVNHGPAAHQWKREGPVAVAHQFKLMHQHVRLDGLTCEVGEGDIGFQQPVGCRGADGWIAGRTVEQRAVAKCVSR